jgi:transcriptional regulator with PAS, ATPase and Fis domain
LQKAHFHEPLKYPFSNYIFGDSLTKDGHKLKVELSSGVIKYPSGNPIGAVAITRDITERKKMENKILQQNEFLNSVLEALTHPFYVIDADDYTIQLANSATVFGILAENSTCYQVTQKRKKPCSAKHPCPLEIVKKTKKPTVTEHIHYDKNGKLSYIIN